jgi:hypothetical protein
MYNFRYKKKAGATLVTMFLLFCIIIPTVYSTPIETQLNKSINTNNYETLCDFTLTIIIEGNGEVIIDPDQETYDYGTVVNLTAVPDTGWSFTHWSGDLTGDNNSENITMDDYKTVTAHFTINIYNLYIDIEGNGTVIKDPDQSTYEHGTVVELTAVPDTNWTFEYWSGDLTGDENPQNITIDSDKYITANFTNEYTLTIITNGSGCVFVDPEQDIYEYGTVVELLAYPWDYWWFSHWDGDLNGSTNPEYITMDSDKTVIAYFYKNEYTLTIDVEGNGEVIKDPDQSTYEHGTMVELTAESDSGWTFDHWSGDLTGDNNPEYITMDENKTVTAHFVELIPDLRCSGALDWTCKPGDTVTGDFTVENVGDPESLLDWEIVEWPEWGQWSFTPMSGVGLKPEDGSVTVQVTLGAPKNRYKATNNWEFTGEVTIVNQEDSGDSCTIPVNLNLESTNNKNMYTLFFSRLFERFPNLFQLLQPLLQRLGLL